MESDCLSAVNHQCFDYILTNPLLELVRTLFIESFEQAFDGLKTTGELLCRHSKKQGMPSAKKKIEELFGNVEIIAKSKGYYILKSIKRLISKWYSDIVIKCKNLCSISVYFYVKWIN